MEKQGKRYRMNMFPVFISPIHLLGIIMISRRSLKLLLARLFTIQNYLLSSALIFIYIRTNEMLQKRKRIGLTLGQKLTIINRVKKR